MAKYYFECDNESCDNPGELEIAKDGAMKIAEGEYYIGCCRHKLGDITNVNEAGYGWEIVCDKCGSTADAESGLDPDTV
jgi:hypothetical protein